MNEVRAFETKAIGSCFAILENAKVEMFGAETGAVALR